MDIVTGYIDGLLQVNLKASQHKCDYYKRHAKKSFETALDDWDRANDFWLSWNKKINLTEEGLAKILNVTPEIIEDIHTHCDGLEVSDAQFNKWMHKYKDPNALMKKVISNLAKHGIVLVQFIFTSLAHLSDGKFYDCGKDIGTMLN